MKNQIELIISRIKEVNDIIGTCSEGTMPFEHANVFARFYYDYKDTNVIIDEAETIAA